MLAPMVDLCRSSFLLPPASQWFHYVSTVRAPWLTDALTHINVLELTAAHFALLHLAADAKGIHIQLKLDNLGGTHSPECNQVAQQIWEWAVERGICLSAAYIPGESNVVADFHSRCFHENKEWALKVSVFDLLSPTYGSPGIDLFNSSRNAKLPIYISWLLDQLAYAVDAFTVSWQDLNFMLFLLLAFFHKFWQGSYRTRPQAH